MNLDRPTNLDAPDIPLELAPFVKSINQMVGRLVIMVDAEKKFIADAAHELRTPITGLQIQAENLERVNSPERLADLLRGVRRAAALIDQLLKLARADSALDEASVHRVDLRQLIVDIVADYGPIAARRSIDLGVDEMADLQVVGVSGDYHIIIRNLVDNAIRYSPDGSRVDINVYESEGNAVIEVRDNGAGLPPPLLSRVFDRFFRAATDSNGSGLGLSIVRALVFKHKGSVHLNNRDDGTTGLVATVGFPAARHEG